MAITRKEWASKFLNDRHVEVTQRRMNALISWESAEGSMAKFNPLATTKMAEGATDFNTTHVKNYTSLGQGIKATWLTLDERGHNYEAIVYAITNNLPAKDILLAVAYSAWGTGWLALTVLPYVKNPKYHDNYAFKTIGQ